MATVKTRWETPARLFNHLDQEFRFTLDAAADWFNAKCDRWLCPVDDALQQDWSSLTEGPVWCNPPYTHNTGDWVCKARDEARKGLTVAILVFVKSDTTWWHDAVMRDATEVCLVKGRVKHERLGRSAQQGFHPSCVVIFTPAGGPPRFSSLEVP